MPGSEQGRKIQPWRTAWPLNKKADCGGAGMFQKGDYMAFESNAGGTFANPDWKVEQDSGNSKTVLSKV